MACKRCCGRPRAQLGPWAGTPFPYMAPSTRTWASKSEHPQRARQKRLPLLRCIPRSPGHRGTFLCWPRKSQGSTQGKGRGHRPTSCSEGGTHESKKLTSSPRGKYQTGNQRPKVRPHSVAIHSHPQFYVPHFQIFIFISKTGPLLQASPFPSHVPSLPRPPHHHGCTAPSSSLAVSQLGQHPAPAPDLPLPLPVGVASQRCLSLSSPPARADALTFTTALHVLRPGIQEALNQC